MKILLISLQKTGGGALDGIEFSNGLVKNGFRHAAVISAANEYAVRWDEAGGVRRVFRIPTYGSSMKDVLLWTFSIVRPLRLMRTVAKEQPDILHIIDFHPWALFLYMMRPFLGYKIFYAPQDNPFNPKERPMPAMEALERLFVKRADTVAAYSEYMKADLARFIRKPIMVLPLGVYPGVCPGIQEKEFNEKGRFRALFFGRIEPYKGVDILVKAMEMLSGENLAIELTIAGRGEISKGDRDAIARLGIDLRNRWVGDDELCSLIANADVLVAPYKKGTQSGIISVGLACRMPLIVTDVGSFSEYVEDGLNGFLIPPDAAALADRLRALYADRALLKKMSDGAGKMAERYSWTAIAKKAVAAYGSVSVRRR